MIEGALVVLALALLLLAYKKISIGWIALPIAAWAAVLLLRPKLSDAKRFVLFLIGTAMLITIVVEVVVVRGDIGRQNTIFKFYMQAWILLASQCWGGVRMDITRILQVAAGLACLLADCDDFPVGRRRIIYGERHRLEKCATVGS